MNRIVRLFLCASLVASLTFSIGISASFAQDAAAVNPASIKVLVDNDRVRILDALIKVGAKEVMHSHPAYVSVILSGAKLKITSPDGKAVEKERKTGEALYNEAATHTVENIGTTDFHVIITELKK